MKILSQASKLSNEHSDITSIKSDLHFNKLTKKCKAIQIFHSVRYKYFFSLLSLVYLFKYNQLHDVFL